MQKRWHREPHCGLDPMTENRILSEEINNWRKRQQQA
jgi:hypothetical protein